MPSDFVLVGWRERRKWSKITKMKSTTFTMHQLIFFFLCYILPKNAHKMHIWNPKIVESESNAKWFCVKGRKIRRKWSKITKMKSTTFTRHQLIFFFVRYILHRIAHKMHTWNPEIVHCESSAEWFCVWWGSKIQKRGTAKWSKITKMNGTTFTMHQFVFCFLRYILHRIVYKMYIWKNETV